MTHRPALAEIDALADALADAMVADGDRIPLDVAASYDIQGKIPESDEQKSSALDFSNDGDDAEVVDLSSGALIDIEHSWLAIALTRSDDDAVAERVAASAKRLSPSAFTSALNRTVYERVRSIVDSGNRPDPVVVAEGQRGDVVRHIAELLEATAATANLGLYEEKLAGAHQRRRRVQTLTSLGNAIAKAAKSTVPTAAIIDDARKHLDAIERPEFGLVEKRSSLFVSVAELLQGEINPPDEVVQGLLCRDEVWQLFGPQKSLKSGIAQSIAVHVQQGMAWAGRRTERGLVVYIAGEGHAGIKRRFRALELHHDLSIMDGEPILLSQRKVTITDETELVAARREIKALPDTPILVIVDTVARCFGSDREESSAKDMGYFLEMVDRHLREPFRACVLLVHHIGHNDSTRGRGSSALGAGVDGSIRVSKHQRGAKKLAEVELMEAKELPEGPIGWFEARSIIIPGVRTRWGDDVTGLVAVPMEEAPSVTAEPSGKNQRLALEALRELYLEHEQNVGEDGVPRVNIEDWRTATMERLKSKNKRDAWNGILASARENGWVSWSRSCTP